MIFIKNLAHIPDIMNMNYCLMISRLYSMMFQLCNGIISVRELTENHQMSIVNSAHVSHVSSLKKQQVKRVKNENHQTKEEHSKESAVGVLS